MFASVLLSSVHISIFHYLSIGNSKKNARTIEVKFRISMSG